MLSGQPLPSQSDSSSESDSSDYDVAAVKKQKVNEEDGESSDFARLDLSPLDGIYPDGVEEGMDDGYFDPNFPGEELGDFECWKRYWDQIYESQGFDFKDYPGSGPLTSVFPVRRYLEIPKNVEELKGYASKALEGYNEEHNTKYEVKDILKLNGDGCKDFIFYLALMVKIGEEKYFQIKVVRHMDQTLEFPIVRPRVITFAIHSFLFFFKFLCFKYPIESSSRKNASLVSNSVTQFDTACSSRY